MAILGIDEVGRGPLAGPLVIGAVILPEEKPAWVAELKDSKQLSPKKREKLSETIVNEAPAVGLGWVSPVEIDERGMSEALNLATRRAVRQVQTKRVPFSQIVIDGKVNFLKGTALEKYVSTMIRADDLIKEVSAASIVAKVARDKYMTETAARYPEYGFEKHMGYGTAAHRKVIERLGLCPEHRRSFEPCKSMVGFSREEAAKKNTTSIGAMGERVVMDYLTERGHETVAQNYKTYFCEIDLVTRRGGKLYFTEVKYRKSGKWGGGFAAITAKKQAQMKYAAEVFLKFHPEYDGLDPMLAAAAVTGEEFEVEDWVEIL